MATDLETLTSTQIDSKTPAWLDHLGRVNRERLTQLLPLFENGTVSLGAALAVIAPGKERPAALAAYQTFAKRVNDAAKEAGLPLTLKVDSKKKSDPADRETWIEGPSPDAENLAQFTREAVSIIDEIELVEPSAVILTPDEQEDPTKQKPLIRFFVSYAHADDARVKRLQESLEKELQIRKQFKFEVWSDRKIEVGENWDEEIREALAKCHFGLLFLSRDFLLSKYITENELPLFVNGTKPVIPVGLRSLDLAATDLKGLEAKQLYRLKRDGDEPRFFDQCRGGNLPQEFVLDLANQIEKRVASWLESDASRKLKPVFRDRKSTDGARSLREDDDEPDPFHELVTELGHFIIDGANLPACPVAPEAAPADLHTWEKDASILTQNRTQAVDYLAEWATTGEGSRFAAVLGEVGIGKTTTLMLLSRELDRRREKDPTVPAVIFIDLKDYYFDGDPDLEDILAEVIKRHWKGGSGRAVTPQLIVDAVQKRGALVIFDGLDERIIPLPQARRDAFIRQLWKTLPPLSHKPEPGTRPGRLIISCRSHYFPTVTALSSAFTGEGREGIRQRDYTACVILPFNEKQVHEYLGKMLGRDRIDDAVEIIRSVHNLEELSTRPYLLSLIAPELAELERMKKEGKIVLGVTLYGLFVEKWLRRDEYKHQFTPEHKLLMMEALAAHLCEVSERKLPWRKVAGWLDGFLDAHPEIRDRYTDKPAEVLNQDFRAATFCLRPDNEKDGFRFAHTSLFEYFLALHLVHSLEENRPAAWDVPLPSDETFDFIGQLLAEGEKVDPSAAIQAWTALLEDGEAPAQARRAAFRAWLVAHRQDWPVPMPKRARLHDLDLEGWEIGTESRPPLDLRGASLKDSCLDHAVLRRVLLTGADATGASARLVELQDVTLTDSIWENANLCGGTWRDCPARNLKAATANWHDCDVIRSGLDGAELPEFWKNEATALSPGPDGFSLVQRLVHSGSVQSVAWSLEGAHLLSGGDDGTVKVWDSTSGRCIQTFSGHQYPIWDVALSTNGNRLLSAASDGSMKVWDAASGRCLLSLFGCEKGVTSVAWSPDNIRLLSGDENGKLKVWDTESGRCLHTFAAHKKWVGSVAWSPDGTRLLSGGDRGTLKVWDAESGRCLQILSGHENGVGSVAWSPDGTRMLSAGNDPTIRVWDADSGRCLHTLSGHKDGVGSAAWSPDGTRLLSGGNDRTVKVWDAETGQCLHSLSAHLYRVLSVAWSPNGASLFSGSDGTMKVWDTESGRCLQTLTCPENDVETVAWSPDGARFASGGYDRTIRVWHAESGRRLQTLSPEEDWVSSLAWSPDGTQLLSGDFSGTVRVRNAETGETLHSFLGNGERAETVAWSADGSRLLVGDDQTIKIWDAESGSCLLQISCHHNWIRTVAWSPDGLGLVSGGSDGTMKVWNAESGRLLDTLSGHEGGIESLAWSPDSARILSGGDDRTVKLWDAASGDLLYTLSGHENVILSVAWSPDATRLLSACRNGIVKLWDAESMHCLRTVTIHDNGVIILAWSPDGQRLLSGGDDRTIREWDVETGALLRTWMMVKGETALLDFPGNRILHASPGAWRYLGWQGYDEEAGRRRLLPGRDLSAVAALVSGC